MKIKALKISTYHKLVLMASIQQYNIACCQSMILKEHFDIISLSFRNQQIYKQFKGRGSLAEVKTKKLTTYYYYYNSRSLDASLPIVSGQSIPGKPTLN